MNKKLYYNHLFQLLDSISGNILKFDTIELQNRYLYNDFNDIASGFIKHIFSELKYKVDINGVVKRNGMPGNNWKYSNPDIWGL